MSDYNEDYDARDRRRQTLRLTVTTPTTDVILSLALAKNHLRIRHTHEDADITALVEEGTQWLERRTGRSLRPMGLRFSLGQLPHDDVPVILPRGPVTSITSASYIDSDGNTQPFGTALAQTGMPGLISAGSDGWPTHISHTDPAAFVVDYVAGYLPGECPAPLVRALKLWIDREYHDHDPAAADMITRRIDSITQGFANKQNQHIGLMT